MSTRPHGYARYKLDGCRCYPCGYAVATYNEQRTRAIAYGTWQPWADAEPVREHLRNLQACGVGLRSVARLTGIDRKRLQAIVTGRPERGTGPQERVRPALATAVLMVEPALDNLPNGLPVDATGTRRRLRALVARGWPQARLAVQLGVTPSQVGQFIKADRVLVRRARAVQALYTRLWDQDPRAAGVDAQAYSRAINAAAHESWPPPAAWDDDTIDDPVAPEQLARKAIREEAAS